MENWDPNLGTSHVYLHRESQLRLMARMKIVSCMKICMVCIRVKVSVSCQDNANAYANGYDMGVSTYTDLGPSRYQSIEKSFKHPKSQAMLHVYLDRESQHRLMSCMRMKTCMKMVTV